jgi:hypothetical protein
MSEAGYHRFLMEGRVPFGQALPAFVEGYFRAYQEISDQVQSSDRLGHLKPKQVNEHFFRYVSRLSNHHDPHFAQSPVGSLRVRGEEAPDKPSRFSLTFERLARRSDLITRKNWIFLSHNRKRYSGSQPIWIYSPLYFSRILLTSPEFPASDALAHATIRAFIFEEALRFEDEWSSHLGWNSRDAVRKRELQENDAQANNAFLRIREIIRFDRVEASLQKLENYSRNRDTLPLKDATDFVVSHLLASRGLLMMRLDAPNSTRKSDDLKPSISFDNFLESRSFVPKVGVYQFDVPKEIRELPSASRLINELDGLPIAMPGADLVFQGGLRFTTKTGVVARLYGSAGIGKTSFALAIAASLAPIGTRTIYLSCEERSDDLHHRIRTLVPLFIKRTQSYSPPEDWFTASFVSGTFDQKREQITDFLDKTIETYGARLPRPENCPPGLMPLLIVLDGVHEMFPTGEAQDGAAELRKLVERCQETGALVLALSAETPRADLAEFDYLVDMVAHLEYAPTQGQMEPKTRLFNLEKSRRQLSRGGAHVLDLSGREHGVRIIPQINAHLSENRTWGWVDPNPERTVDFLLTRASFLPDQSRQLDDPLVEISDRSQVLVMGRGSSGKSLFGLRILGSGLIGDKRVRELRDLARRRNDQPAFWTESSQAAKSALSPTDDWFEDPEPSRRRLLVLSFLYQRDFYLREIQRSKKNWQEDSIFRDIIPNLSLDVVHFSPGYLRPESLIDIVNEKIVSAILSGKPYHGVLIDGIHNVFLQFPHLESSEIVWPALFELLRVRGLSVVTTHTHFDLTEYGTMAHDLQASRRRVAPLLHALVQSSDYVIKIHPIAALRYEEGSFARSVSEEYALASSHPNVPLNETRRPPEPARFLIEVPGSLSATSVLPPNDWAWEKDRGVAYQPRSRNLARRGRAKGPSV